MNVKLLALIFVSFFIGTGCQTCHQSVGPNWKMVLTSEQEEYLNKYCHWRGLGIFILRLSGYSFSPDPTVDEIRSAGAHKFLKMPKTASWDDVMKNEKVAKYLTEENREKYSRIFLGRKDAGWIKILEKVETLRKLRRFGEVATDTKRPPGGRFFFC